MWKHLKINRKKELSTERKGTFATGGGTPQENCQNSLVDSVISQQFPLTNILDDDHVDSRKTFSYYQLLKVNTSHFCRN